MGGFAHIGFLQCLAEKRLIDCVDTWVGCSIGSLVAMMSAVGMTPSEMYTSCLKLNDSIFSFRDLSGLWEKKGLDDGEYFYAFMVDILVCKGFDPGLTFLQLQRMTGKRLIVSATNLSTAEEIYLSPSTTPDEKILRAVRMSVGIPFLFTPVLLNGQLIVDGGVTENYPLEYAMHDLVRRKHSSDPLNSVLGCNLEAKPPKSIETLEEYLSALVFCALRRPGAVSRLNSNSVRIYLDFDDTFDFSAPDHVRFRLRKCGYEETQLYLQKHPRWLKTTTKKMKID